MSKALDYLLQARPEAMRLYFGFLKEAGKHLDSKTRAIISIITKVDNQTEAGFQQYLRRALRAGVTANEIIDALLCAFPSLGLTKITWAMDQLLALDLPEFRLENLAIGATWHDVTAATELVQAQATSFRIDGKFIYVYTQQELISVYDGICPHQATLIEADRLSGCHLTCPRHQWKFDLTTGVCVEVGDKPLMRLEHKLDNGRLYVRW
ncbi:MAG: carboxymuconolactone decarboxylase [Gammaproteobacteria bacterium]|nr:carboxymuconolactone decarboxylase [Gammaproteobacteria bacterium]